jgi:NADH-quinone oxidoreductase subunit J
MNTLFLAASVIAVISTLMVVTRRNAVHALLYLVVSFLSVAIVFFLLGAAFIAALEVIIYAGAIMVLFIFVVMMFNIEAPSAEKSPWLDLKAWAGPALLCLILLGEFLFAVIFRGMHRFTPLAVSPKNVGRSLFGPYLLAVELAAMLLLSAVVGAYHLGRQRKKPSHRFFEEEVSG